jgi:hypothetical protein
MAEMMNRRRAATNIRALPPDVVPISPEDHQQAVAALTEMIEQWWRNRHDVERRIVLLTVFRKTRDRETSEVERAIAAQKVCEVEHRPATHLYDREGEKQ